MHTGHTHHDAHERQEEVIKDAFLAAVVLKMLGSAGEIVLGSLLLFTNSAMNVVLALIRNHLLDDPDDFFAVHFKSLLMPTHDAQVFGGAYLLIHGIVKLFLFTNLWRNKLWAYPATLAVMALFIGYEILHGIRHQSLIFLWFMIFDLIVVWLIFHEYRLRRKLVRDRGEGR